MEKIDCRVLDPASLQVNRRARGEDRPDRCADAGVALIGLTGAYRPCLLHRSCSDHRGRRRTSLASRTPASDSRAHRILDRIKGLLLGKVFAASSRDCDVRALIFLTCALARPLPARLRAELERQYARLDLVETQLRVTEAERTAQRMRKIVPSIQTQHAHSIAGRRPSERGDSHPRDFWSSFCQPTAIGLLLLGLTPSAYDSGISTSRCQGISKAGNSFARRVMIEVASLWRKYQPDSALAKWYEERAAGQSPRIRRIMLVALARKLVTLLSGAMSRSASSLQAPFLVRTTAQQFPPQCEHTVALACIGSRR